MKSYPIHRWCRAGSFILLGAVLLIAYRSDPNLFKSPKVALATSVNITGYAWINTPQSSGAPETGTDQGLGWISMNGTNYGVNIDTDTGYFSGYAWIGNGDDGAGSTGWVKFDPDIATDGPYPGDPQHGVWREGNMLTGWAKVLSLNSENANNGWIKMSGTATDGSSYGVTIDPGTGKFSGYAWGSDVIGWVDFAPTIGGVPINDGVSCPSCVSCTEWSSWSEITNCAEEPASAPIMQTRYRICGETTDTETADTGKTCDLTPCTSNNDCGGGQICVVSTGICTDNPGGVNCGNNVCNPGESLLTCPQDCKGTIKQI